MDVPRSAHMEQYGRLIDLYGITPERRVGWLNEMAETFDAYPLEAVTRAVNRYRKDYAPLPGAYVQVPPPGTFAEWVYQAADDLEAEALGARTPGDALALPESAWANLLPPPVDWPQPEPPPTHHWTASAGPPPSGPRRDVWEWNVAYGMATMGKRKTLIDTWRREQGPEHDWQTGVPEGVWKGLDDPTETEVLAQLQALRQQTHGSIAQAEAARSNTRRGRGRMRFEWKDGEVSDVTLRPLGEP